MEKSANTIGRHKFLGLDTKRQHRLLAELAREALGTDDLPGFLARYEEMTTWAELDRYDAPAWLTPGERLQGYWAFHSLMGGVEAEQPPGPIREPVLWRPTFPVEVILDRVRSPFNFGSVLRLVDNFGLAGVVHNCSWIRLDHPRLQKSARGCQHWIPVRYEADLPAVLRKDGLPSIALETDADAIPMDSWHPPSRCRLVLGNESGGIAQALKAACQQTVRVPLYGHKRSMNLHHALAIAAFKVASSEGARLPRSADFC